MADAFLVHIASGTPLAESLLTEAHETVEELNRKDGDSRRLCELAVNWVAMNPTPLKLPSQITTDRLLRADAAQRMATSNFSWCNVQAHVRLPHVSLDVTVIYAPATSR